MNLIRKYKLIIGLVVIAGLVLLLLPRLRGLTVESIVEFVPPSIPLAILIFALIYAAKAIVIFPPLTVLYVAAGIVFPAGLSVLVTYIGIAVLLTAGYVIGKILGKEKVYKLIKKNKKLEVFMDDIKNNRLLALCFIVRIIPINDALNLLFGALDLKYWKYLLVSMLGLTPYMLPVVLSGAAAANPLSLRFLLPFGISLAVLLLGYILYRRKTAKTT